MKNEFTSLEFLKDPGPVYDRLREEGAFVKRKLPIIGTVWIATTQSACAAVLKNSSQFSVRRLDGSVVGMQWWMPKVVKQLANNMLALDEPDHTRLRNVVEKAFHRDKIIQLEPRLKQIADEMVANLFNVDADNADLVKSYAREFPLAVICELLGLRDEDRPKFTNWAASLGDVTGMVSFFKASFGLRRMSKFLEQEIARIKREGGLGLVADLVGVNETDHQLSDDEMVSMVFLLLIAGHETTSHLISGAVLALFENPDQRLALFSDPDKMPMAVEEFLRFSTAVLFTKPRNVREDVEIDGVLLKRGDVVMPILGGANHDPGVFDASQKLVLDRKPNRHMSFGSGIHFCLGHQLARLELRIALEALFKVYPDLQMAEKEPVWRQRFGMRALKQLLVKAR